MENSILYAKIAVSEKIFFPKLSFKYYIGLIFIVAIILQILNNVYCEQ